MDRSRYPVRILHLHDIAKDESISKLSPSQRVEIVWELTMQSWAFKEGLDHEPRLRRDVVRIVRRKS